MFTCYYSICGVNFQIDSEQQLAPEMQECMFRTEVGVPDVWINLQLVREINEPSGVVCKSNPNYPVWRRGNEITRICWDMFQQKPHFQLEYSLLNSNKLNGFVREDSWEWAAKEKYLWNGIQLNHILLHHKALIFHSSFINYHGNAILFVAPSQTGKSTQANLWHELRDAEIINGDKAGVKIDRIPKACGVPFSGTSGICKNCVLPVKAVVVLSQAPENKIRRMNLVEAVQALCPNIFVDQAITEEWTMALELLLNLIEKTPIYSLACTPDERAVITLENTLCD